MMTKEFNYLVSLMHKLLIDCVQVLNLNFSSKLFSQQRNALVYFIIYIERPGCFVLNLEIVSESN